MLCVDMIDKGEVSNVTSEELSGLAPVSMDGTGKALASAFDAVKDSFASAATSLSASAATVEYEKFSRSGGCIN
jgi:hypothetical protein